MSVGGENKQRSSRAREMIDKEANDLRATNRQKISFEVEETFTWIF
jgi:hypothetical protein